MAEAFLRADSVRSNPTLHPENLRTAISAALRQFDTPPTRFGIMATNDPCLIFDILPDGREPRRTRQVRIRNLIASLDR